MPITIIVPERDGGSTADIAAAVEACQDAQTAAEAAQAAAESVAESVSWPTPTVWTTATAYSAAAPAADMVTESGNLYVCLVSHTSGTFATDLAASKWRLVVEAGVDGSNGSNGTNGTDGEDGWSPVFGVTGASVEKTLTITDWTGGTGTKPATGDVGVIVDAASLTDITDAQAAAVAAVEAEGDTQVARVAATPGSTIYADDVAGLAATASGGYYLRNGSGNVVATVVLDNAGVAVDQEAFPSYDYVSGLASSMSAATLDEKRRRSRTGSFYNKDPEATLNSDRTFTFGVTTPTTGSALPAGTYMHVGHPVPAGPMLEFYFYGAGTKTIKLKRLSIDGTTITLQDEISLNVVSGPNTFLLSDGTLTNSGAPWIFDEGDILAVHVPVSAGYYASVTSNVMEYLYSATEVTTTYATGATPSPNRANQLQYKAVFTSCPRTLDVHPLESHNLQYMTFGPVTPIDGDTGLTSRRTYFMAEFDGLEQREHIYQIRGQAFAAFNCVVAIYAPDASGENLTRTRMFHLDFASVGLNTFTAGQHFPPDVYVEPGGCIAFWSVTNVTGLEASTTQGESFLWYETNAPKLTIAKTTLSSTHTANRPQISFDTKSVKPTRRRRYLFDQSFASYIPRSFFQTGWSVSGGYAVNSATTLASNQLRWHNGNDFKRTSVSGRASFWLKLDATSQVAVFRNKPATNLACGGTIATIENTTGVIVFRAAYAGSTTLPAASAVTTTASWLIGNTNLLRIDLTKNHYAISLTVTDTVTGNTATISYDASVDTNRQTIGLCMGAPGVSAISGTVRVLRMQFKPARARVDTMFFGDSHTHGEGADNNTDGWAIQAAAVSNGLIAACPGHTSSEILKCMRDELQAFRPKNVVIMAGSNDTDMTVWEQNLNRMVTTAINHGATPFVCTLPPETSSTVPVVTQNPIIAALPTTYSQCKVIDMARAVTTNGDGSTLDGTLNNADGQPHFNTAGHTAMYNRFLLEAPECVDETLT
jgi:lysophospholipase L1-like esterase